MNLYEMKEFPLTSDIIDKLNQIWSEQKKGPDASSQRKSALFILYYSEGRAQASLILGPNVVVVPSTDREVGYSKAWPKVRGLRKGKRLG